MSPSRWAVHSLSATLRWSGESDCLAPVGCCPSASGIWVAGNPRLCRAAPLDDLSSPLCGQSHPRWLAQHWWGLDRAEKVQLIRGEWSPEPDGLMQDWLLGVNIYLHKLHILCGLEERNLNLIPETALFHHLFIAWKSKVLLLFERMHITHCLSCKIIFFNIYFSE